MVLVGLVGFNWSWFGWFGSKTWFWLVMVQLPAGNRRQQCYMAMATHENAERTPVGTAPKIRAGPHPKSGREIGRNNGGSGLRNSIPIKHLSCYSRFDSPTNSTDEAIIDPSARFF